VQNLWGNTVDMYVLDHFWKIRADDWYMGYLAQVSKSSSNMQIPSEYCKVKINVFSERLDLCKFVASSK
jgi:hypothetical protein